MKLRYLLLALLAYFLILSLTVISTPCYAGTKGKVVGEVDKYKSSIEKW